MKLASLVNKNNNDGELVVVSQDHSRAVSAKMICPSLREAVEHWSQVKLALEGLSQKLNQGRCDDSFKFDPADCESCLPRTWLFADGSAFIHHIKLVRKARNAPLPETLTTVPLMYQAESARFLAPTEDIPQIDFAHGTDFEAEVGVITDFVPMGTSAQDALDHIVLVTLINDVSLRGLIPAELAAGFGFFQSKPAKALAPLAVTPDELGGAWRDGRVHLPLNVKLNGEFFGKPHAGAMHFHFGELIAHAAKTRDLQAGTLIGSGTVSNEDSALGSGCLAEKRTLEQIATGTPVTPFMRTGDKVEIWMENAAGVDLFGRICQRVMQRTLDS
jgi:fumarylacetoacetate (FAA) hydrolase